MSNEFSCTASKARFPEIEIRRDSRILLTIILVSINEWAAMPSPENIGNVFERVKRLRKEGRTAMMLWEDYWLGRTEIVKSRLLAMCGISQKIPARLAKVSRIDKVTAQAFLEKNHLNGSVGSKYQYGLFLPDRYFRVLTPDFQYDQELENLLVAVATFSHPRIFQRPEKAFRSYELIRFASLLSSNVVGGLDKLLAAFIREKNPDDIMTYADLEWSDGRSYVSLGFEAISETPAIPFLLDLKTNRRFAASRNNLGKDNTAVQNEMPATVVFNAGSVKYVKLI